MSATPEGRMCVHCDGSGWVREPPAPSDQSSEPQEYELVRRGTHVVVSKSEWAHALKAMGVPEDRWQDDARAALRPSDQVRRVDALLQEFNEAVVDLANRPMLFDGDWETDWELRVQRWAAARNAIRAALSGPVEQPGERIEGWASKCDGVWSFDGPGEPSRDGLLPATLIIHSPNQERTGGEE